MQGGATASDASAGGAGGQGDGAGTAAHGTGTNLLAGIMGPAHTQGPDADAALRQSLGLAPLAHPVPDPAGVEGGGDGEKPPPVREFDPRAHTSVSERGGGGGGAGAGVTQRMHAPARVSCAAVRKHHVTTHCPVAPAPPPLPFADSVHMIPELAAAGIRVLTIPRLDR
jgi:hypothetical protein